MTPWWQRRMCSWDLETTGPLPEHALPVQAAVVFVGGGEETERWSTLIDPGVPIPPEATAVHGITDAMVKADGMPAAAAALKMIALLEHATQQDMAHVAFNIRYDATVLDRERRRHELAESVPTIEELLAGRTVDPSVLDKFMDRYRRSYPQGYTPETAAAAGIVSTRKLEGMCKVYGASLEGAHDAAFDAIAAGRLAWVMGSKANVIRRKVWEQRQLQPQWDRVRHDLPALHDFQYRLAIEERDRFEEYKRSQDDHEEADRIALERGWPVLELMPHELNPTEET